MTTSFPVAPKAPIKYDQRVDVMNVPSYYFNDYC